MSGKSWSGEWLNIAQDDLRAAEHLTSMRPVPMEIICFHCQQAVEKALKAALTSYDIDPPRMHDLTELCRLCAEQDEQYGQVEDTCALLTAYGVQTRYPPSMELEQRDVDRALEASKSLVAFVERLINSVEEP